MSDETFSRLSREAKARGFPGMSSYLLSAVDGLTDEAQGADIVKQAIHKISKRDASEKPFILKSLFDKGAWNGFSVQSRIAAGRLFYSKYQDGGDGIEYAGKNGANHHTYIKIE
jgi:hypothetical protein